MVVVEISKRFSGKPYKHGKMKTHWRLDTGPEWYDLHAISLLIGPNSAGEMVSYTALQTRARTHGTINNPTLLNPKMSERERVAMVSKPGQHSAREKETSERREFLKKREKKKLITLSAPVGKYDYI